MKVSANIDVRVNGAPRRVAEAASVEDLLVHLGLLGKRIAVERNGEIVPRSQYRDTLLADGDTLEIVGAVGGG